MRGATSATLEQWRKRLVSIRAPLARGDYKRRTVGGGDEKFQSAPLLRGATGLRCLDLLCVFVSIRAPLARGDGFPSLVAPPAGVSIRAPLARGDAGRPMPTRRSRSFNPRPSCEGRQYLKPLPLPMRGFNPRPSCEGRLRPRGCSASSACFNPRPSCEGRPRLRANWDQ